MIEPLVPVGYTPEGHEIVPCALCRSTDSRTFLVKFDLRIAECSRCKLVFASPRLRAEESEKRYNAEYFWHEYLPSVGAPDGRVDFDFIDQRHAPMLEFIARQAGGRGRLLEVGTGAGLFLKAAERAGWEVAGIELSPDAAAFARDRLQLQIVQQAAETSPFERATFDAAVMFDVIEHLRDPLVVLAAVRRALKADGVLVIATPNLQTITRWVLGSDWASLSPAEHFYYFTERTLCEAARAAGFRSARIERSLPGYDRLQAMNAHYTHAPRSARTRGYAWAVARLGAAVFPVVKAAGLTDALLCVARNAGSASGDA